MNPLLKPVRILFLYSLQLKAGKRADEGLCGSELGRETCGVSGSRYLGENISAAVGAGRGV